MYKLLKPINHLAIIMDGNGRWAKERNKPRTYGHKIAIENLIKLIEECNRLGIKGVSLFAFSTENFNRPKDEVSKLFNYLNLFLKKNLNLLIKNNIKLIVSGDYTVLPKTTVIAINNALSKTINLSGMRLNICLNYGGQDEIIHCVNSIIKDKLKSVDKKTFEKYLYSNELGPIDLLIRTSGEQRISNFMLYQLAYSEFVFDPTYFPDFDVECLHKAIDVYNLRDRRYGAIKK